MKQIKTIFALVLMSAVLFSCSNARYGHMKKVKKNEKATVQKHERKNKQVQPADQVIEEIAAVETAEEITTVNETVTVENAVAETAPVAAATTFNANTPKTTKTNTVTAIENSVKDVVKNNVKETVKATETAKKKGRSGKSQIIALILVALVGGLGIHRFYLGYTWQGVVQLLTGGGCGIWWLIDLVRIITGDLKPKDGEYDETL